MKNIILLIVALVILFPHVFCNKRILSKLHQNAYKIKDVRVELLSYNKNYFNIFEIKTFKYNRTTAAHNFTFNAKVDTGDKVEVVIQLYKFLSNEYRPMAVRFQVNLQKAFKSNAMGLQAMTKCGNVTLLYFYKDVTYHICNFMVDETQLPPLIPSGQYKIEGTQLFLSKQLSVINVYCEVYTPIVYPKK